MTPTTYRKARRSSLLSPRASLVAALVVLALTGGAVGSGVVLTPAAAGGSISTVSGAVVGVIDQVAVPSDVISVELADLIAGRRVSHAHLSRRSADRPTSTTTQVVPPRAAR